MSCSAVVAAAAPANIMHACASACVVPYLHVVPIKQYIISNMSIKF